MQAQANRRFASKEDAFRWMRMPGMELVEEQPPAPPEPIVNRCWCGKRISSNRNCCRECREAEIKRVAQCLTTNEALELFLASFGGDEREALLAELQPYLHITDFVEEVAWHCECGQSGVIHVRVENSPDENVVRMALEFHHNTSPECPVAGAESKRCSGSISRESGRSVNISRAGEIHQPDSCSEPAIDEGWVLDTE